MPDVRRRYAQDGVFEMSTPDPVGREAVVTVRGGASGVAQTIESRSHRMIADEPADAGGADTGPTPYELLVAALGS